MLPHNGAAVRFASDAVKPYLLPTSPQRESACQSSTNLFSDTSLYRGSRASSALLCLVDSASTSRLLAALKLRHQNDLRAVVPSCESRHSFIAPT